ncbi:hypothetical protein [Wolbachia endosymbiont of Phyllotreta cruciferae]|nr:hypothetical protein [Wolbachia endosymbiont of Phyllotreta cruciferae]
MVAILNITKGKNKVIVSGLAGALSLLLPTNINVCCIALNGITFA